MKVIKALYQSLFQKTELHNNNVILGPTLYFFQNFLGSRTKVEVMRNECSNVMLNKNLPV